MVVDKRQLLLEVLRQLGGMATLPLIYKTLRSRLGESAKLSTVKYWLRKLESEGLIENLLIELSSRGRGSRLHIWVLRDGEVYPAEFFLREFGSYLRALCEHIRRSRGSRVCFRYSTVAGSSRHELRRWSEFVKLLQLLDENVTVYKTRRGAVVCLESTSGILKAAREGGLEKMVQELSTRIMRLISGLRT
jgi:hypothetical protein